MAARLRIRLFLIEVLLYPVEKEVVAHSVLWLLSE